MKVIIIKYLKLETGNNSIEISKLVLGTDYFGTNVTKEESFKLMDEFVAAGGNCLDTARVYAEWLPGGSGASEKIIGEWLKLRGIRDKIIISTKGGHPPLSNMHSGRLSKNCIESDLDQSLKLLGVDYIDIYWLHRDDINRPVSDIMETLQYFIDIGKVRAIGCSNWKVNRINEANNYAINNGLTPFAMSQILWSLATSTPEAHKDPTIVCMDVDEYSWHLNNNFPVMAYSSQAKGFFAIGARNGLDKINQKAASRFCTDENIERLERVKQYAKQNQLTPTAVALGYILCNKLDSMAIIGCKNTQQLQDTLTAKDIELSADVVEWLFKG